MPEDERVYQNRARAAFSFIRDVKSKYSNFTKDPELQGYLKRLEANANNTKTPEIPFDARDSAVRETSKLIRLASDRINQLEAEESLNLKKEGGKTTSRLSRVSNVLSGKAKENREYAAALPGSEDKKKKASEAGEMVGAALGGAGAGPVGATAGAAVGKEIAEELEKETRRAKKSIRWIIEIVFIVFIAWFLADVIFGFVQTPFGQLIKSTLQQYIPISQIKDQVGNQLCMAKCYLTGFTSVGTWTAAGGLDKYCQTNCQTTAQAEQLGCTNCYSLTPSLEEPTPVPLSSDTIKLTLDTPEGKKYSWGAGGTNVIVPIPPALNPIISITSNDFVAKINEKGNQGSPCNAQGPPNECDLTNSVGPNDVPIKLSADFNVPCKSSAQYDTWFSYGYNVTGVSFVKFKDKNYGGSIDTPQPTSSPGQLKFNIQPYTDIYNKDVSQVRITLSLINQGDSSSTIKINSINISQIEPSGYGKLTFDNCIEADIKSSGNGWTELSLPSNAVVLPEKDNAINFHCTFTTGGADISKLTQSAYYTILATAKYTYKYKITGDTVFPDPRYSCRVTAGNWKMAGCFNAQGVPISSGCQNSDLNGASWSTYGYDDSQWGKISLPDSWTCSSSSSSTGTCSRFYRLDNIVYDKDREHIWFNITSSPSSNTIACSYATDKGASNFIALGDKSCDKGTGFTYCNDLKYSLASNSPKHYYSIACSYAAKGTGSFAVASDSQ